MPEPNEVTQNPDSAVAVASDPSADASQPTGSKSKQPDEAPKVDAADAGDEGKPGSSDEGDGASSKEPDRSRPSRAERRISELDKQAKDYQKKAEDLEDENSKLKQMLKDPLKEADIKLPDYSQQDNVTPAQLKQDIVNAADQIVKLRLDQYIPQNNREMTVRQYRERAYEDIQSARSSHPELDETNDETFEPELDKFLAETYKRVFDADPAYRFRDLVKDVFKQRGGRDQKNTKPDEGESANESKGSKGALRQTGGNAAKSHKPIADMTASEYREYFASTRR